MDIINSHWIQKYLLIGLLSVPLVFSKDLRTVGSESHNRLGRIGPFAVVDILAVVIISYITKLNFFLLILVGIVMHMIFCIKTPLNTMLDFSLCEKSPKEISLEI